MLADGHSPYPDRREPQNRVKFEAGDIDAVQPSCGQDD